MLTNGQTDRQTGRQKHTQTDPSTVTLAVHVCQGLIDIYWDGKGTSISHSQRVKVKNKFFLLGWRVQYHQMVRGRERVNIMVNFLSEGKG